MIKELKGCGPPVVEPQRIGGDGIAAVGIIGFERAFTFGRDGRWGGDTGDLPAVKISVLIRMQA
jgi:hypothetical protein